MDLSLTADGRPLEADDVRTAHHHMREHVPLDPHAALTVCASAIHAAVVPTWPCSRRVWAERVLAACERGEVTGVRPGRTGATG